MENTEPRINRGRFELMIPHEGGEIAVAHPFYKPNTYRNVGAEILGNNQRIPTGDEAASFIYSAYCSKLKDEPEFEEARSIMKNNWFWVFNRVLWTPKGVYVIQDPEAVGRSQDLDESELEKYLSDSKEIKGVSFSKDNKVRFAKRGTYELGTNNYSDLAKNGFVIASHGLEGAEKLSEVSKQFHSKPYIYGLDTKVPEQRVSALGGDGGFDDGLGVDGSFFGGYGGGLGFGVFPSEK
jgi:hypothetical protein